MDVTIAPPTSDDAEAILVVHYAAVHQTSAAVYSEEVLNAWAGEVTEERIEKLRFALAGGDERFLIARLEGQVVGFGSVVLWLNELRGLYVSPKAARRGVGTELLTALEALAFSEGASFLKMDASLNAEAFYLTHGYETLCGGVHVFHSGQKMDCVKMRKSLEESRK